MHVNYTLSDDRQTAHLTIKGPPDIAVSMSAADMEAFIGHLSLTRSLMQPPIPPGFLPAQKVMVVKDFGWLTEPDAMEGNSILHLGHPGIGWLHFLFAREQAAKLADTLRIQVKARPPVAPPGSKPN